MVEEQNCLFCDSECEINNVPDMHTVKDYRCKCCGSYLIDCAFMERAPEINKTENKFKIACILNERRLKGLGGIALSSKTDKDKKVCNYPLVSVDDILDHFPKKASEFITRSLVNLSKLVKLPFDMIELNLEPAGKYYVFSAEGEQAHSFLRELENQGWIISCSDTNGWEFWAFTITNRSWELIDNLKENATNSKRAFVAMWFDESMNAYFQDGIKKAIQDAGYEPVRIDLQDFNGKICDEIIAEIKRCKFVVSDFSGQRGGVYFEAGFAQGLGRSVIFTVKQDDIDKLHFDTRQYNHIVYDSPEELYKKLYNRICATIV